MATKRHGNILDQFSPLSVGKLIPTSTEDKKDIFESFRPTKEQNVDYKISETFVKMQQGDYKINAKEIVATYEPLSKEIYKPSSKKPKLFSGGPPKWKFVDEIWHEQQQELQNQFRKQFKQTIRKVHKERGIKRRREHAVVQELVGPEWFIELSPMQLKAVDRLEQAINQDLKANSINDTREVLADLGLVLRPNKKQIKIALRRSFKSPVEFLLMLYQITNPRRQSYSTNDRLLLSAVVHLTITETLRELHIRIPSPPKTTRVVKKSASRTRNKPYESPYLQSLQFIPQPPKHSGVYKNANEQCPESPYFSYLESLSLDKLNNKIQPRKRVEEYTKASDYYNRLPGTGNSRRLIPPSLYSNLVNKEPLHCYDKGLKLAKLPDFDDENCCCPDCQLKYETSIMDWCESQTTVEDVYICDECLQRPLHQNNVKIIGGLVKGRCECEKLTLVHGTAIGHNYFFEYRDRTLVSKAKHNLAKNKTKHVIAGIILTKLGPVYNILSTLSPKKCRRSEILAKKKLLTQNQKYLADSKIRFVIGGVTMTTEGPVYIVSTATTKRPCKCFEQYRNEFILEESQCQIMKEETKCVIGGVVHTKLGPQYYITAILPQVIPKETVDSSSYRNCVVTSSNSWSEIIKETNSHGEPGNIIDQPQCSCLQDHINKIKQIEDYKLRAKLRYDMQKQFNKFHISGVSGTPRGPAYLISGASSPVKCQYLNKLEEEKVRPLNTGRINYEISGVRAMPEENVYIISRALPVSDCKCAQLLKRFESCHERCLKEYDLFLRKIDEETHLYMEEIDSPTGNVLEDTDTKVFAQIADSVIVKENLYSTSESSESSLELKTRFLATTPQEVKTITCPKETPLPDYFLSRQFAIFKEFPKKPDIQIKLLQYILCGMAEDGFPLAKLPQCHKLPIFRLWFEMRSGECWTQTDKLKYCQRSKQLWRHTDLCYQRPRMVRMPFDAAQAARMTWRNARLIKKVAADRTEEFYRNLKQVTIDTGREFFATTFPYEFPQLAFRDCAFAYIPTKEEAVFGYKIVKPYDTKVPLKKFDCYC